MGKHTASHLSLLIAGLLIYLGTAAPAMITFEAIRVDGVKIYSGDAIPSAATFNISLISSQNLSAGTDAITIRLDSADTALTPSSRTANASITASHSATLPDGLHNLRITAKDVGGTAYTWEATNLNVDAAGELKVLGTPLNLPNPCTAADTSTAIGYSLTKPANVTLSIHDLMGNLVKKYSYSAGSNGGTAAYNEVTWDLKNESGTAVGNGIYIYLLIGDGKLLGKGKIAVIK